MGLFSNKRYVGVDIGTASIKVVELEDIQGKAQLLTYGFAVLPNDLIRNTSEKIIFEITEALKQILEAAGIRSKKAFASLPGYAVFTQEIEVPSMPEKELASAIRFEAEKYVPIPIKDTVLDWEVIEEFVAEENPKIKTFPPAKTKLKKGLRVLLTAAPRHLVVRYNRIFSGANMKLESLETEALALSRSLVGYDRAPAIIIDMGATATDIIVVEGGSPRLTKTLDLGGRAITNAIARSLHINPEKAEQFKKDIGLSNEQLGGRIPETLEPIVGEIISALKHISHLYNSKTGGRRIEKIILAGAASKLPQFREILENLMGTKVYLGDPFARVLYPQELRNYLAEIGPDFAVALGLAMRNIY